MKNALALTRNIPALKGYLFENYKNLGYTDQQAQELTDKDTAEYKGMAEGGRIMKAMVETLQKTTQCRRQASWVYQLMRIQQV